MKVGFVTSVASFRLTDVEIASRSFAMKQYHRIARQSSKQNKKEAILGLTLVFVTPYS
jgi:hypothetical protein